MPDIFGSFDDAEYYIETYEYYRLCSLKYFEQCKIVSLNILEAELTMPVLTKELIRILKNRLIMDRLYSTFDNIQL